MILTKLRNIRERYGPTSNGSLPLRPTVVRDPRLIERFDSDRANSYLVGFPRTGSHYLQILMERYFQRPSLPFVYYYPESFDYLTRHVSDLDLDEERENVLYVYRDPVDTVYSQLRYCGEPTDSKEHLARWTVRYAEHLEKWLLAEQFTRRKTTIRYESLHDDLAAEFGKVCAHFELPLDKQRLQRAATEVNKWVMKQQKIDGIRVSDLADDYTVQRQQFRADHGDWIWKTVFDGRLRLYSRLQRGLQRRAA